MSLRKSARLSSKIESKPDASPQQAATITTSQSSSRSRKKHKTSAAPVRPLETEAPADVTDYSRVKGRRGKLKVMTEVPLDILLEIFCQLEPLDLLHISRATKDLRAIIIDNNHAFLWKRVYENAPAPVPPPCPSGMNILHYTNFIYGRHCQSCASIHGRIIHWAARIRLCSKCVPTQLINNYNHTERKGKRDEVVLSLCFSWHLRKPGPWDSGTYVLAADFKQCARELVEAKNIGEEAVRAYHQQRSKAQAERHKFSWACYQWRQRQRAYKAQSIEAIRNTRQHAVRNKLEEAGYRDIPSYVLWRLPHVRVAVELTDREWDRIKDDVFDVVEERRRQEKERSIVQTFQRRIQLLEATIRKLQEDMLKPFIFPTTSHVARSEPFCSLIKDTPLTEELRLHQVEELATHIPGISDSWRDAADNVLLGLIPQVAETTSTTSEEMVDRRPLELATTFFKCHWCDDPLTYPRVLMHSCLRSRLPPAADADDTEEKDQKDENQGDDDDEDENMDEADKVEEDDNKPSTRFPPQEVTLDTVWSKMSSWYSSTWNEGNEQVLFDEEASGFGNGIIQACGEDPKTITHSEMNKKDARVECVRCSLAKKGKARSRLVMNWKMAILHDLEVHYEDPPTVSGWQLITNEGDIAKAKETESKSMNRCRSPTYLCRRCNLSVSKKYIKNHLASHQIACEAAGYDFDQDIYLPLDTPMKIHPYAVKI